MTDENIDLRFLAEQGKRILDELGGMRTELAGMKKRTDLIPEIAVEVAARCADWRYRGIALDNLHDLSGVKMRVERIERRTGIAPQ